MSGNFDFPRDELRVPRQPDWKVASTHIENPREIIPASKDRYFPAKTALLIDPFEDVRIWIQLLVITVDARIGNAAHDFVIAGIGKILLIADAHHAAFRLVAEQLPIASDFTPEERQERFASRFRCVTPEIA